MRFFSYTQDPVRQPSQVGIVTSKSLISSASKQPKAIALLSGGLDSALAAALVKSWGVEVTGLHLNSPFGCVPQAKEVAEELNIPLIIREKGEAYIDLVGAPSYGYGSQMNPCVDCRIYMFQMAEKVLIEVGAHFIVTGEVVGQRPLSQNKANIALIEKNSPLEHRVLRPLSGGNLPPTLAEEKGWVQRHRLLKISGRGRNEQLALANQLGLKAYSSPGGGCLLTESAFSDRLKDFYANPTYANSQQKMLQAQMLKLGRHFKITNKLKVIVARNEKESQDLGQLWENSGTTFFKPFNYKGPVAIALGAIERENETQIASLLARYGRKSTSDLFKTQARNQNAVSPDQQVSLITTQFPMEEAILNSWRIGIT